MDAGALFDWLFSEAGAGWVFGLVMLAGLVGSYLRRHRPSHVVVREVSRTSLVSIRSDVRERIEVSFDGERVSSLAALDLEITNEGSEVIRKARVTIDFGGTTTVLEASHALDHADMPVEFELDRGTVTVNMPYLNPFKEHRQGARVICVVDGSLGSVVVRGSGEGWSAAHSAIPGRELRNARLRRSWWAQATALLFILVYHFVIFRWLLGIPGDEMSVRAFISFSPAMMMFLAVIYYAYRTQSSLGARTPRVSLAPRHVVKERPIESEP